jgi:tetratricopeptide (TPR) repeat protein
MQWRNTLFIGSLTLLVALAGCGPTKAGKEARADARARLDSFSSGFTYDQAEQEFRTGQFERALRAIDRAIEQDPNVAQFHVLRGRILIEMNLLERALESIETAIELNPDLAEAYYFAGIVQQRWTNDELAVDHYSRAFDLEGDNLEYLLATAETMVALGEFDAARELVESKLKYFERDVTLVHLLAQIAQLEGDPATAVRLFEEARMLSPEDVSLKEELMWAQFDAGMLGDCLETTRDLQTEFGEPRMDLIHVECRCLNRLGRSKMAHNRYLELTRMEPEDPMIWIEFGALAWELGDMRRVAQCSVRAIALAPERFEGYLLKGLYEQHAGRPREAVELFRQAAEFAPDLALPQVMLGRVLESIGEYQPALDAYGTALETDPTCTEAQTLYDLLEEKIRVAIVE